MKKFKDVMTSIQSARIEESKSVKYDRDAYVTGRLFQVGDVVSSKVGVAEILHLGSNYVTLVKEGVSSKAWIHELRLVEAVDPEKTVPILNEDGVILFKGYSSKHIPKSLVEKMINRQIKPLESFSFYNCILACDSLFKITESTKFTDATFNRVVGDFDRTKLYLAKLNIDAGSELKIVESLLIGIYMERANGKS